MKMNAFRHVANYLIILILWVSTSFVLKAQDPVFSQFYHNPLGANPAFAGNTSGPLFHLNYRNQWPSFNSAYTTYALSYSQFFSRVRSGLGLRILHDQAGDGALQTTNLHASYAYRIKIRNGYFIKGGMEAGFGSMYVDWNRFTFGDAIDPRVGPISPGGVRFPTSEVAPDQNNRRYFDLGAGILIYNQHYYAGVSLQHINTADITFLQSSRDFSREGFVPMRFTMMAGYQYLLKKGNKNKEDSFLSPSILFSRQAGFSQIVGGLNANFDKITGGMWYRHSGNNADAVIALLGVKMGYAKFFYSYDYTVSALTIAGGGSHELGIVVNLESLYPEKQNYNDCLSIFR